MPHPRISSEDIHRRGNEIYESVLRAQVETPENIGKQIVIDVETGDFEIGEINGNGLAISHAVLARHPGAALLGLRIGYNAVYSLGGVLTRTVDLPR